MEQNQEQSTQNTKKRKRRRKSTGCLSTILYLFFVLAISVGLSVVLLLSANDVFAFVKDDEEITVSLKSDTHISEVSEILFENGVIEYKELFDLFIKFTEEDTILPAGEYDLNSNMDYGSIVSNLETQDESDVVTLTIPEGYTVEQIRDAIVSKGICDEESIDSALNEYPFKHDFLEDLEVGENWLEGYLFPDTYEYYKNDDAVQVINRMLNNFAVKYNETITEGAKNLGYSMHEIVTIASLIEREAQKSDEFAKISGVIHNRLNDDDYPYLQIDATIQYIIGHTEELSTSDLKVDSPYNTYTNIGLPPGPIANPGYAALYAATYPESHDYYYYVAMPDGSHLFGRTLTEHNKNISEANEAFDNG